MRKLPLAALLLLGACHSRKTEPAPDYAGIRSRANAAFEEPTLKPAPEAPPAAAKVLEKDKAGCTWLESEGLVTVGEQDTRHQARAAAVSHARSQAMRQFLGVEVRSRFLDFQQEGLRDEARLTEDILQTTRSGRILDEKVLDEGYGDLPGCSACRYRAKVRVCIVASASGADKDFQVEAALSRTRFVSGDEAEIVVVTTRDSWLYVYDVGMDGRTWMIADSVQAKAGGEWRSEKLGAELPDPKSDISAETVRVVAAKAALPRRVWDPADGGWLGVLRRLHASGIEWTDDAQAFTIYRK